jgi:hypothetical protein
MTTAGTLGTPVLRLGKLDKKRQILGVFSTCMGKLVNGVKMIMSLTTKNILAFKNHTQPHLPQEKSTAVVHGLPNRTVPEAELEARPSQIIEATV